MVHRLAHEGLETFGCGPHRYLEALPNAFRAEQLWFVWHIGGQTISERRRLTLIKPKTKRLIALYFEI
jgi:hypothetical protein